DSGRGQPQVLDRLYTIADEAREIAATMDFAPPKEKLFQEERQRPSGGIITPQEERRRQHSQGQTPDQPGIILP
ncbi:MAG: hypothetical protein ACRDIB_19295, partial [Ardenticatenaceae bacterium]